MSELKKRAQPDVNNNNIQEKAETSSSYHQLTLFQRYGFQRIFGEVLVPLFIQIIVPISTMTLWHICRHHSGSILDFLASKSTWYEITFGQWQGSFFALYVIAGYMTWAIILTLILPGDVYYGPVTDKGNKPEYINNGFSFYLITLGAFLLLALGLERVGYSVTTICDRYGEFVFAINVLALTFCLFLYFKGKYFPSSTDNGTSGNPIFDYYWGVELYPRIGKVDVKLITNCRWGMMIWTIVVILFWMKSLKMYGFVDSHFVTMFLIVAYLAKFFWWEAGYMKTIDICVDRAGFYLCYGCLSFVPLFYALPSIYLAYHPVYLGWKWATLIFLVGFLSLYVNYDADRQRYLARET
jgi:7-dehydrocholesterol reductase